MNRSAGPLHLALGTFLALSSCKEVLIDWYTSNCEPVDNKERSLYLQLSHAGY